MSKTFKRGDIVKWMATLINERGGVKMAWRNGKLLHVLESENCAEVEMSNGSIRRVPLNKIKPV